MILAVLLTVAVSCTSGDDTSVINNLLSGLTGQVFTDPAGDIFGSQQSQHDILSIEVYHNPDANAFLFKIIFNEPVLPVTEPDDLEQLYGYLEIDSDQIQDSGSVSTIDGFINMGGLVDPLTNMWVDYTVVFHSYDGTFRTVDINAPDPAGNLAGYAPIIYEGNTCLLHFPIDVLTFYDGSFKFGLLIGTAPEATDLTVGYMYVAE